MERSVSPLRTAARLVLLCALAVIVMTCGGSPTGGTPDAGPAPVTAAAFVFDVIPATVQAGTPQMFSLRAVDVTGGTATGYRGTVHLAASSPSTALGPDYAFVEADLGAHAFPFTATSAGPVDLRANDTVDDSISGHATTTCIAGPAAVYRISSLGAALQAHVPTTFDVTALDAYDNVASGYGGSAVVTSSDPLAVLPANPTFAAGVAKAVGLTFMTPGSQSVTATDTLRPSMTATVTVTVAPEPAAGVTAPEYAAAGSTGLTAFVADQPSATYVWSLTNGSITAGAGTHTITFSVGSVGTSTITCIVSRGGLTITGVATVHVVAVPITPTITGATVVTTASTGNVASVTAHADMTYQWTISGGTITSAGGATGVTVGAANGITYTAGAVGTIVITCEEVNAASTASAPASFSVASVAAPVPPVITAPAFATVGFAFSASASMVQGLTYTWKVDGVAVASTVANGVTSITVTPAVLGSTTLECTGSNGATTSAGTRNVVVVAAPATPVITAASPVDAGATGRTASVVAHTGMTYLWTLTGGAITSGGGAAGITAAGVNTITYTAGPMGTIALTAVEINAAAMASAPGSASVMVVAGPVVTPTVTSTTPVTSGVAGLTATVNARFGMTYAWTITGGTITSPTSGVTVGSTNTLTFTAGSPGSLVLTCAENNGAVTSAPGTRTVTVVAAPVTPVIAVAATVPSTTAGLTASVAARAGMTYAWSITNGTITSATSGVISNGIDTVTFTSGVPGTLTLAVTETNLAGATSAPGTAWVTVMGGAPTGGHLYVVAHEDDDLLFANPDIEASIVAGHPTRVVFVVAAGSPDFSEWQAREHGVYEPYLMMANATYNPVDDLATYYTCGNHTYNGFPVRLCTMTQNTKVSLVFLRLPDGDVASLWATNAGAPFFVTPVSTLATADAVNTYTRSAFIATLAAVFADFAPERIGTMDSTLAYGFDHEDHVASALFALEATHAWGVSTDTRIYRGYTMDGAPDYYTIPVAEAVNLTVPQYNRKHAIMEAYGGPFPNGGTFDNWCHRQYVIARVATGVGPITEGGGCVATQGGATADATRAVVAACNGQPAQRWTVSASYQISGPGGKCLTIVSGNAVQIFPCVPTAAQKWTLFANGQVRGQDGLCLTDSGGLLSAALCDADTSANLWHPLTRQTFTQ